MAGDSDRRQGEGHIAGAMLSSKSIASRFGLDYLITDHHPIRPSVLLFMLSAPRHTVSVWCCSAALIVGLGMGVSRAEAACGDYLTIGYGHRPMGGARGTEQLPNPSHVGSPLPSEPARSPCNGPDCSSHEMPVIPLQVIVRMQHDRTGACLAQAGGVLTSPPRWATQRQETLGVQVISFRILRPPRPLALHRSARDEVA
jgi:hypothetical protein